MKLIFCIVRGDTLDKTLFANRVKQRSGDVPNSRNFLQARGSLLDPRVLSGRRQKIWCRVCVVSLPTELIYSSPGERGHGEESLLQKIEDT